MTIDGEVSLVAVSDALAEIRFWAVADDVDISPTRVVWMETTDEVSEEPTAAIVELAYGGLMEEAVAVEDADAFRTMLGCTFMLSALMISAAYETTVSSLRTDRQGIDRPSLPLHTPLLADVQPVSREIYQRQQL